MKKTIDYYNENAKSFIDGTVFVDFTHIQNLFLELLPERARILDFGCGSGRDTKYFLEQGYIVDAMDGSLELCKAASEYTGVNVKHMLFQDLNEMEMYDGIWGDGEIKDSLEKAVLKLHKLSDLPSNASKVEFYYLGRMCATGKAKEFVMQNTDKTAVEIEWALETPVREDIYEYIVNG